MWNYKEIILENIILPLLSALPILLYSSIIGITLKLNNPKQISKLRLLMFITCSLIVSSLRIIFYEYYCYAVMYHVDITIINKCIFILEPEEIIINQYQKLFGYINSTALGSIFEVMIITGSILFSSPIILFRKEARPKFRMKVTLNN
jgi:hypothetical protein